MDVFEYGSRASRLVLLQPVDEHDLDSIENETALIRGNIPEDFRMIAFKVRDWNRDLSPWKAPAVFGREDFGDGAAATLAEMLRYCEDRTKTYYVGGYSLAGLFALWAAYQTDVFQGAAAASPSVWFPGFDGYMKESRIRARTVYLSLGDREEKTRNPIMALVGEKIREAYDLLKERSISCILEWNEGNHFRDADKRTARAFSWVVNQNLQK